VALATSACGGASGPANQPLNELTRAASGALQVVLLTSDKALNVGKDTVTVEFRAADDRLVDVGTVRGSATMPMAGMPPMLGPVDVRPGDVPGRYVAATDLDMVGEWRLSLEWSGPAGDGSVTFTPMVQ
jgi:hypothetical protein